MARIRSIHPGLFSDPEFASLSDGAQIFFLGLLTEADDNGVFDWNPAKLRIRLRPGKDGGVEPLLSELETAEKVRAYEIDGRKYGAVRNFRKFQRPKSPKSWHPIPDDFRNWVGLSPPTSENPPQREEEGGRREDGDHDAAAPAREADLAFAEWQSGAAGHGWRNADFLTSTRRFRIESALATYGGLEGWRRILDKAAEAAFFLDENGQWQAWFSLDWLLEGDHIARLLEGAYAERKKPPAARGAHRNGVARAGDGMPAAEPWEQRVTGWVTKRQWLPQVWGPAPGEVGCRAPPKIVHDVEEAHRP